jgi:hypothetical protein
MYDVIAEDRILHVLGIATSNAGFARAEIGTRAQESAVDLPRSSSQLSASSVRWQRRSDLPSARGTGDVGDFIRRLASGWGVVEQANAYAERFV